MSLYNRNLLTHVALGDILTLLKKAQEAIENDSLGLSSALKHALEIRLELRVYLLSAVNADKSFERERARDWQACIGSLPDLKETQKLGKPVENSFSVKLQRKLASTVPPRPIVELSFDDAWDLLSRICSCGRDAYLILDYHGGSRLQVHKGISFLDVCDIKIDKDHRTSYGRSNRERHSHQRTFVVFFSP